MENDCPHTHIEFNLAQGGTAVNVCVKCDKRFFEPEQYYHKKGVSFTEVNGNWRSISGYVRLKSYPVILGIAESAYSENRILVRYKGAPLPGSPDVELITGTERTSLYAINPLALQMVHGVTAIDRRHHAEPRDDSKVSQ